MNVCHKNQQGAILITSLMLLVVMTILGLSAMQTASMEERMVANMRGEQIAFQAAESALRDAEAWLAAQTTEPLATSSATNLVYTLDGPDTNTDNSLPWWKEWTDSQWSGTTVTDYGDADNLRFTSASGLSGVPPGYVIEELGLYTDGGTRGHNSDGHGRIFYQITARGKDSSERITVLLRSSYARRF